jgi:putative DNA methylase
MTRRKKLIEVALPLEAINKESAREKSIRHGHPSTLHLWWARRPLAACRAVLFAQLVDDPDSDPAYRQSDGSVDEDAAGLKRAQLFNLIEELVKWENSNNERIINAARAEIARCVASRLIEEGKLQKATIISGKDEGKPHPKGPLSGEFRTAWELIVHGHGDLEGMEKRTVRLCPPEVVNHFLATYAPPVLDPFAGGGSIPLEAQRLGLRAHASDLNPVPVLINKALIEIPPKFANQPPVNPASGKQGTTQNMWKGAEGLAEDVRYYGKWMRDEAEKRIGHLYPKVKITREMAEDRPDLRDYVGQELTVIAWLWARTVPSPNPAVRGAHVPLVRSFWLSNKEDLEAWVHPVVDKISNTYHFEVRTRAVDPKGGPSEGIMNRKGGRCLLSGTPMPYSHIRAEAKAGRMRTRLMAIVAEGTRGRVFLSPMEDQSQAADSAKAMWRPDGLMPLRHRNFQPPVYGMNTFGELFTERQLVVLGSLSDLIAEARKKVTFDAAGAMNLATDERPLEDGGRGPQAYADAIVTYLAFAIDKSSEGSTNLCTWSPLPTKLHVVSTFGRQAVPMVWDFAEANLFAKSSGNYGRMTELIAKVIERGDFPVVEGCVGQVDATIVAPSNVVKVVSTDPPYYDNISYADLSDFFYVWLRRSLSPVYPSLLSTMLTPKSQELIAAPHRHDDDREAAKDFFESGLATFLTRARQSHDGNFPLTVFYAFKQTEDEGAATVGDAATVTSTGWETILEAVISSGFLIDGTWPMRTERAGGFRNRNQNALASSIVLSCTVRLHDAPLATRREFLSNLKRELPDALKKLQSGNIAPVDLAQAAIGPGMAVFSRYSKVVESDGSSMTVRTALALINQMLDEVLAEQEGEFDGDTRWAVAWFEQFGVQEGAYGVAETLSKAKNTSVQGLVEAGLVAARGGKVKLIGRDEMPKDWDPAADKRLTAWEATQHLIRKLQQSGEQAAATLLARLGGDYGEKARDLAYRLYHICERKGWAQEALAYNSLVIAWSEISKLSRTAVESKPAQSTGLFE